MVRLTTNYELEVEAEDAPPIRDTNLRRARSVIRGKANKLPFVVWDGEGANVPGMKKQSYVLLGCYDGNDHEMIKPSTSEYARLSTKECLEFIIRMGEKHPHVWHVSFAFNYDVTMILSDLPAKMLRYLHKNNSVWYGPYRLEYYPSKWFRVTLRRKNEPNITVTIEDTFGFFQTSLIQALKDNLAGHPLLEENIEKIESGKARRSEFTSSEFGFIVKYWKIENQLFHALVERLYANMYDDRVNLKIRKWYGPGALASYVYKTRGILAHKADCGPEIYDAARFAYAGGRFEMFHVGRFSNVYGYDINSAYPYAISQLPSLSQGHWVYVEKPKTIARFGVYHVRMMMGMRGALQKDPSPLFHRDKDGNISFPWFTDGWYWSPEVEQCVKRFDFEAHRWPKRPERFNNSEQPLRYCYVLEGWEFVEDDPNLRPFAFVAEMYDQRKRLKAEGEGAQMALKLALNSLYGKMAQRAGWERRNGPPTWHQLEWAGWVTSKTRATLFELMFRIGYDRLIAVETDGLYTTATPEELGIQNSKELGGWEVSHYDEMIYYQSGIYVKLENDKWTSKYRGLDKNSVSVEDLRAHVLQMPALDKGESWPPIIGTNTRFIGLGAAIHRGGDNDYAVKAVIGKWETKEAEISVGDIGKRKHIPRQCEMCKRGTGLGANEIPHQMKIHSMTLSRAIPDSEKSKRHDIPWLDNEKPLWREYDEINSSMYMESLT